MMVCMVKNWGKHVEFQEVMAKSTGNQMRSNSKKNIHIYPQCEERGRGTTLEKHNTLVSEQNKISMNLLNWYSVLTSIMIYIFATLHSNLIMTGISRILNIPTQWFCDSNFFMTFVEALCREILPNVP